MTRFAWLQSRTQTLFSAGALAVVAIAAAITGIQLSHLFHSLVAHCTTGCDLATTQFLSHGHFMEHALDLLSLVVPALFGIFWGAPLLTREFEAGTYRLAWTQSVTRSRWLLTRLAIGAGATLVLAGLLTLTITWWYRAIDPLTTNKYDVFGSRDVAPIAYALFAFAAGALIGAIIKRTLPAMATTLGVYVFARVATMLWVRPHLMSPVRKSLSLLSGGFGFEASNGGPIHLAAKAQASANSWTLSSHIVDKAGHVASTNQLAAFVQQYCPDVGSAPGPPKGGHLQRIVDPSVFEACGNRAARFYHLVITYQPANRYWSFQWMEAAIFVVLALACAAGCFWWVTRRTR